MLGGKWEKEEEHICLRLPCQVLAWGLFQKTEMLLGAVPGVGLRGRDCGAIVILKRIPKILKLPLEALVSCSCFLLTIWPAFPPSYCLILPEPVCSKPVLKSTRANAKPFCSPLSTISVARGNYMFERWYTLRHIWNCLWHLLYGTEYFIPSWCLLFHHVYWKRLCNPAQMSEVRPF